MSRKGPKKNHMLSHLYSNSQLQRHARLYETVTDFHHYRNATISTWMQLITRVIVLAPICIDPLAETIIIIITITIIVSKQLHKIQFVQ